jgi:hypothetical protein
VKPFDRFSAAAPARTRRAAVVAVLAVALVAGLVVWPGTPAESKYLQAATAGGDYLVAQMNADGSFVYEYDPITRKKSSSYNMLRHAGTTFSLIELHEATGDAKYLAAAENGLGYLRRQIIDCPTAPTAACVLEDDEIKLGGNGLALLALSKYMAVTGSRGDLSLAQRLAEFIVSVQSSAGEFTVHKITGTDVDDFESGYYPGEAIYALTQLHELDHNERWSAAAHRGARWLITVRDAGVAIDDLDHDHWLLYGLREVYENKPDPLYVEHAKKIVQAIAAIQHHGKSKKQADWNGGFRSPPRSTPAATRSEGLGAAYALFVGANESSQAQIARDVMEKAIKFQLRTQFTKDQLSSIDGDPAAVGAFHESLDEYGIRIDYVQHNISALLLFESLRKGNPAEEVAER